MASNNVLHMQILAALSCLKTARFDGDAELIDGCEIYLNRLLDKLCTELVPA